MTESVSPRRLTVHLGHRVLSAAPGETLLEAAERQGAPFPSGCRVGGCGACKCRIASGTVRERTETAYLLSKEEIEDGVVLGCQSVPETDVHVELAPAAAGRRGRVVEQTRLTHDTTRVVVAPEAPLAFRPGQFAKVALDGLPGVARSYSFATAPRENGLLTFFVRRVPGGAMSGLLCDEDLVGRGITLHGPMGDFVLRGDSGALLFVAGGSGLAPVLSLLEDLVGRAVPREVTVLFGARTQRDLYAQDEIAALQARFPGTLRFVPVLSDAGDDAAWTGARGLVTEHLPADLADDTRAYLCGPPAMVDAADRALRDQGLPASRIHADRFTTRADAREDRPRAGVLDYLKFFSFHAIGLLAALSLLAGGGWTTLGLVAVLVAYVAGDALLGDDTSTPRYDRPFVLTVQLWLALPLLALITFVSVWSVSSRDPLSFGAFVQTVTGWDVLAARAATSFGHHVSGVILTGLMIGMVGTITAHELTHRTWDRVSLFVGRWLLAFSFDTSFAIEHVYGHHRYVSTEEDPATAPRGRSVYLHVLLSTIRGNLSAHRIEAARLAKRGKRVLSIENAFFRGHAMSVALVVAVGVVFGASVVPYFIACALWGKTLLEIVNYMEHYGMVRNPETPVAPRHSWNTNRRVSSWTMFNLTRHSHHHAQGEVPYQDLRPYPDAPMMVSGYLTTILIALVPPLWHHLMTPKVLAWDRDFATDEERALAARANGRSGRPAMREATGRPAPAS